MSGVFNEAQVLFDEAVAVGFETAHFQYALGVQRNDEIQRVGVAGLVNVGCGGFGRRVGVGVIDGKKLFAAFAQGAHCGDLLAWIHDVAVFRGACAVADRVAGCGFARAVGAYQAADFVIGRLLGQVQQLVDEFAR